MSSLYRAVWRWHFYAGLFVLPFLVTLAATGLVMLFVTGVAPEYGDWLRLAPQGQALPVSAQVEAAVQAHPGGRLGKYIMPWSADHPALVRVDLAEGNRMLAVDPYRGTILRDTPEEGTWNNFMTRIHGTLFLGKDGGPGDFLIETAASLGIVMIVTGLYLWWPRRSFLPGLALKGRALWKSLHETAGVWLSVVLLFFLLSGLAWTGVWGAKIVQAWSTFPAAKWDNVPLSDATHASMNHGALKEVPWTLEQTLMPQSGSSAGITGLPMGVPVNAESLSVLGRSIGLTGRFQISAPKDEKGVWTLSQDSMSYDSTNPAADRTVHVDQYTGKILADVKFADYPLLGKAMAVGIALHEGQLGAWNVAANAFVCLAVIFLCFAGVAMWWQRRPQGKLAAPRYAEGFRLGLGVGLAAALIAAAFPLGGLAIGLFAVLELGFARLVRT